jgi:hypothetical protein
VRVACGRGDFLCRGFCFPRSTEARAVAVPRVCGVCQERCMALRALHCGPPERPLGSDFLEVLTICHERSLSFEQRWGLQGWPPVHCCTFSLLLGPASEVGLVRAHAGDS